MKVKKLIKLLDVSNYICIVNKDKKIVYQDVVVNAAAADTFHELKVLWIKAEEGMLIVFTDKE